MPVKYYAEDDALIIIANQGGLSGGTLRDDFRVILDFADESSDDVTRIDIMDVSRFLPLSAERGVRRRNRHADAGRQA